MNQNVVWETCQEPGLEHLVIHTETEGVLADGVVMGVAENQPFRLHYTIGCDPAFRLRRAEFCIASLPDRQLTLYADGRGRWMDSAGTEIDALRGCVDIDIAVSPFTNTLPIRRLCWKPGRAAEIAVVYVNVPSLELTVDRQRYTCLDTTPEGSFYHYESLKTGFTADVHVDQHGLVTTYADIFRRCYPV